MDQRTARIRRFQVVAEVHAARHSDRYSSEPTLLVFQFIGDAQIRFISRDCVLKRFATGEILRNVLVNKEG